MDLVLEEKNWLFLSRILTLIEERLRQIFRKTWNLITGIDWVEKDQGQVQTLKEKLGKKFKEIGKAERDYINSGEVSKWDLPTLAKILRSEELLPLQDANFSANINVAVQIRNFCSHHPTKNIPNEEFLVKWAEIKPIAGVLGVSELFINQIEKDIDDKTNSSENKYLQLKSDGNLKFKNGQIVEAIKLYTSALLLPDLSDNQKGVLYSNRCQAYQRNSTNTNTDLINLALSDAENCVKYCENWFKSHLRLGEVYLLLKNYEKSLISFGKALQFEPNDPKIKEMYDSCKLEQNDFLANSELDPYFNQSDKRIVDRTNEIIGCGLDRLIGPRLKDDKSVMGVGESDLDLGIAYRDGKNVPQNFELAAKFFMKSSLDGNLMAKYNLALFYMKGQGVVKNMSKGIEMIKILANDKTTPRQIHGVLEGGIAEAQFSLGMAYLDGLVVEKSIDMALKWFSRSAENGCGPAGYKLGAIFDGGKVIERNEELGMQYLELAASNQTPNPSAMERIAYYYMSKKDSKMAKLWWDRGESYGNMDGITKTSKKEFEQKLKNIVQNNESNVLTKPYSYESALKHPQRKMNFLAHRLDSKQNEENKLNISSELSDLFNIVSSQNQTSTSLINLKFITLKEMDPTRGQIYEGFKIKLRIIDNPIVKVHSSTIKLVVQDEDLASQIVSIFNFDILKNYMSIVNYLGFGFEIVLLNPYMKMNPQGTGNLQVDEPGTMIYLGENNQDICRFCIRPNAEKRCSICKVLYCSRDCQADDIKQGHKLICKSNE